MEEQKHQESDDFKRAKLDLQKTMRKVEAEYRTCWREKLKQKTMRKVEELQKELLLQSTSPPEQPRNVATDTAPPESASRT